MLFAALNACENEITLSCESKTFDILQVRSEESVPTLGKRWDRATCHSIPEPDPPFAGAFADDMQSRSRSELLLSSICAMK